MFYFTRNHNGNKNKKSFSRWKGLQLLKNFPRSYDLCIVQTYLAHRAVRWPWVMYCATRWRWRGSRRWRTASRRSRRTSSKDRTWPRPLNAWAAGRAWTVYVLTSTRTPYHISPRDIAICTESLPRTSMVADRRWKPATPSRPSRRSVSPSSFLNDFSSSWDDTDAIC